MRVPTPENEAQRIEKLHQYTNSLNSHPESDFDELVGLAAQICETPMAQLSLIGRDALRPLGQAGLIGREIPREISFCAHAIVDPRNVLLVRDACADDRFSSSPMVVSHPRIRFYAGAALLTSEGFALGALAVLDRVPRELNPEQIAALRVLSRQAVFQMEVRRSAGEIARLEERCEALAGCITRLEERAGKRQGSSGLIPICSSCKKIRDSDQQWWEIETYMGEQLDVSFTHSICQECTRKLYPEVR
ncbi:MAG: GAF domain-containing protein [Acidobacteriota bacterium]